MRIQAITFGMPIDMGSGWRPEKVTRYIDLNNTHHASQIDYMEYDKDANLLTIHTRPTCAKTSKKHCAPMILVHLGPGDAAVPCAEQAAEKPKAKP